VIAASRQVAPKASTAPFAAQTAYRATAVPQQSLTEAARCFSRTARSQNVEEKPESALNESEKGAAPDTAASEAPASEALASEAPVAEKKGQVNPNTR
jgi:hypothetical protein